MTTNFEHVSYGSRRTRSRRGWSMTLLMTHTGIHGSPWYRNGISNIRARSGTSGIVEACQGLSRLVKAYQENAPNIRPTCARSHLCTMASYTRYMAVTLPTPIVVYRGVLKNVFPHIASLHQLVGMVNVVIEIWCGANEDGVVI